MLGQHTISVKRSKPHRFKLWAPCVLTACKATVQFVIETHTPSGPLELWHLEPARIKKIKNVRLQ